MNTRITFLAAACALALAACGDKSADTTDTAAAPATPAATTSDATPQTTPAPAEATAPAPAAPAPGSDKPTAVVTNCATQIEGTDAMQYNVGSITVPASCSKFTITLKHIGQMPVTAMGHNVVIAKAADMQGVTSDGIAAGAAAAYVKPGDARVIAHSELVGGGQTTTVTFTVASIQGDGPYEFFCSFPGHSALMKGTIAVG
jgi:azurin